MTTEQTPKSYIPCTKHKKGEVLYHNIKPSISSHSKPRMRSHTRCLTCFALEHSVFKTKHMKCLVQAFVRVFEWVEILGLSQVFIVLGRYNFGKLIVCANMTFCKVFSFLFLLSRIVAKCEQKKKSVNLVTSNRKSLFAFLKGLYIYALNNFTFQIWFIKI